MKPPPTKQKRIPYSSPERYAEIVKKLETTNCRLLVTLQEYLALNPRASTKVPAKCIECQIEGDLHLHNLLSRNALHGCLCNNNLKYTTVEGKARLDAMVEAHPRFEWADFSCRFDNVTTAHSRVWLKCSVCFELVNPTVNKLQTPTSKIGCGCTNTTELKCITFVRAVCENIFPERNIEIINRYRDPALRNSNDSRSLEFDIAVFESLENSKVPLLFIEVDGRHHFDSNFTYGIEHDRIRYTFDNDIAKELHTLKVNASMLRLEQRTVEADKGGWENWTQSKIEASVNRELPNRIYRLSAGKQYMTGEYADRRKNTAIDPVAVFRSEQPDVAVGVPVVLNPKPSSKQRTILEMFASHASTSNVSTDIVE